MNSSPTIKLMPASDPFSVLLTPAPDLSQGRAQALLGEHYGIDCKLQSLVSERDQNFLATATDGREYVLKVSNSAEPFEVTDFQTNALMHIARAAESMPVPRVVRTLASGTSTTVALDDQRHCTVRVLTWLQGVPLKNLEKVAVDAQAMGSLLASLGIALQDFEAPVSAPALLWDLKHAADLAPLVASVTDQSLGNLCGSYLEYFVARVRPDLLQLRSQTIYNDLNPSNILVAPQAPHAICGIIDFGDLAFSPLIVDVAVACAYLCRASSQPLAEVFEFVRGYHRVQKLQAAEVSMLFDLIVLRHVMTVLITHWRATKFPENREYILRNEPRAQQAIEQLTALDRDAIEQRFQSLCKSN